MTLLESGPAKTDRYYWLIVGLVFVAYAGWCVCDGSFRYYDQNRKQAEEQLLQRGVEGPYQLDKSITQDDFNQLRAVEGLTRTHVREAFGEPLHTRTGRSQVDVPGRGPLEVAIDAETYASLYGLGTILINQATGRVDRRNMDWQPWEHSPDDIRMQYIMAIVVGLVALYFLSRAYKAAALRAVIDDEGLTYGGTRIAFGDMVSVQDYNPKGWVDLYHQVGDRRKRLRIDNQKIARFEEIVELICEKKGFENPVQAEPAADEAADEPADDEPADASSGTDDDQAPKDGAGA